MRHDQRLPRWQIHHSMRSHRSHRSLVRHDGISLASSPARSRDRPSLSTSASPRAVPVPAAPVRVHSRVRSTRAFRARVFRAFPRRARARVHRGRRTARERVAYSIGANFSTATDRRRRRARVVASRRIARRTDDSNACAPTRPHDRASSTAVTSRVSKDVFDDAHEPAARRPLFDYLVFAAAREGRGDYILLQMRAKTTTKARPKRWW